MTITPVGSLQSVAAFGATRRAITTRAVGDLLLLAVQVSSGATVTGVTSGNASGGWARVAGPYRPPGFSDNVEIWGAAVSATGPDVVVASFSSGVSGVYVQLDVQEFSSGLGSSTTWQVDTWGGIATTGSSATLTYPALTPATPDELYFGHGFGHPDATAGSTPGVTYVRNNAYDQTIYAPDVSGAIQPTGGLASPSPSGALAVLVAVVTSTTTTGGGGGKTVTSLAGASLSGSGALGGAAILLSAAPAGISLLGSGVLLGYPGSGAAPVPVSASAPPPPPFAPAPPTAAGLTLYGELGPLTAGDADLGYPLRTFADAAAGQMLQVIDDLCRDTAAGPGWSQVVDPGRAPEYVLPWLGQFVGVPVDAGLTDAAQRAQLVGEAGFARGTLSAVQAAANRYLKTGQSATITERDGDPYTLTVRVFDSAVSERSYADVAVSYPLYSGFDSAFATYQALSVSLAQVKAAVLAAKPAGLIANVILQGFAALSGSGSLAGAFASTSSAVLAGAGRLLGAVASTVTAALAGAGALAGAALDLGPNALVGQGRLTGAAALTAVEAAVFNGRGALSGTPIGQVPQTAALAGAGALAGSAATHSLPTLTAFYPVAATSSNTSTLTTATFTPAVGDVLVVKATSQDTATTIGGISGGGLTWKLQVDLSANANDPVRFWTAVVGASPAAMAVSVGFGGTGGTHGMVVERWGNAVLAANPAIGASQSNTSASQTITTVGGASVVSWIDSDWNVITGTPAYRGSGVVVETVQSLSGTTIYHAYQPAPTPGVQTFGVSSPTGQKATMVGIEIQSASG